MLQFLSISCVFLYIVGTAFILASFFAEVTGNEKAEKVAGIIGLVAIVLATIFFIAHGLIRTHTPQPKVKQVDTVEYSAKNYRIVEKVVEVENQRDTFYLVISK